MIIFTFLRTLVSYLLVGLLCILFVPPLFFIACLPAKYRYDNRVFFFLLDCLYKLILLATFSFFTVYGKEYLPTEPAIFVANHQSAGDIPMLGALCNGYPHVWLVLDYYVGTPVMGFFVRRMFIPVDRADPAKAARSLIRIYRSVQNKKRHLLIFPEGKRYIDGKIHEFFAGFAVIARKTERPVIPVFVPNNRKIFPLGSFLIHHYPAVAIVGKPFYMGEQETDKEFTERVRQWFVEQAQRVQDDC